MNKLSAISTILLKNIYSVDKKLNHMPMSKELLLKHSSGYSNAELEECLAELKYSAYIDITKDGIVITKQGISLVQNIRLNKIAKAITIIVLTIIAIKPLIKQF